MAEHVLDVATAAPGPRHPRLKERRMSWVPSRVTLERFRMRRRIISGTAIV